MKKFLFGLVAATSLVLTGCGGGTCDKLNDAFDDLNGKIEDCGGSDEGEDAFDSDACEDSLDSCSDGDKDKLESYADCISDLPDCESGKELEYLEKISNCSERLEGLSSACAAAGG